MIENGLVSYRDPDGVLKWHTPERSAEILASQVIPASDLRNEIDSAVHQRANNLLAPLADGYGPLDFIKWAKTVEIFKAWFGRGQGELTADEKKHFEDDCGSMTEQVYFETRVVSKVAPSLQLAIFVKGIRSDILEGLKAAPDADVPTFDYVSAWETKDTFKAMPIYYVSQAVWDKFIDEVYVDW